MDEIQQNDQTKSDVKKVLITNLLILILLVILFFVNQKTGIVLKLGRLFGF